MGSWCQSSWPKLSPVKLSTAQLKFVDILSVEYPSPTPSDPEDQLQPSKQCTHQGTNPCLSHQSLSV